MSDTPIEVLIPIPVPVPVLNDDLMVEVERLRADLAQRTAEVAKANAERDEARRMCCVALMGTGVWRQPRMNLPGGSWTPQLIAKEHGWDCFDEKEARP